MLRSSILVTFGVVILAAVLLNLMPFERANHSTMDAPTDSYIVQAESLEQALDAVTVIGAEVTHKLGIINAVGANLTTSQVKTLRQMAGVKVLVNSRAAVTSASEFVYSDNAYPIEHFESQGAPGDACLSHPEYERTFAVSDNFIIDDLNVGIDVEHNDHGNLRVNLTSPGGTTVTLVEQDPEGDYLDNYNFYLDDESAGLIHDGANHGIGTTFERSVFPDNALSAFDGQAGQRHLDPGFL